MISYNDSLINIVNLGIVNDNNNNNYTSFLFIDIFLIISNKEL